jgi:hypothetical protein
MLERGDWDGAFAIASEHLGDTPTSSPTEMVSLLFLAEAALQRGGAGAARWLDLALPDAESGDYQQQAAARFKATLVCLAEGRPADALAQCVGSVPFLIEHGYVPSAAYVLDFAVTLAHDLGRAEELEPVLRHFEELPPAVRTRIVEARCDRARGALAAAAGDDADAESAYARALAGARNLDRAAVTAPILADFGGWLVRHGREDDGAELLAEARALFERMGATVWLARLDALVGSATSSRS